MSGNPDFRGARPYARGTAAAAVALLVLAGACQDQEAGPLDPQAPPASEASVPGGTPDGWDLPLSGEGVLTRTFPGRPCMAPPHREFDFWAGEWNVFNSDEDQIGTNVVTKELDGCLVQEHWTASNGNRGRSLNVYDRETGMWHQDWASNIPQGFTGRLRTSGGLDDGTMVLTGQRPATGGFTWLDRWTWTETPEGSVIQTGRADVPEFGLTLVDFTATYVPGTVTPANERPTPFCQAGEIGGATRRADFLVGEWSVSGQNGVALGSSTVETDLRDCLFVEHFESRGGLEGTAFTYYDLWVERWFRIWVDSEGERLVLAGDFDGSSLVLEGTEGTASGEVDVRLSWTPANGDLIQKWEVSRDGGASWKETATLVYGGS